MSLILALLFLVIVFLVGWQLATLAGVRNLGEKTGLSFLLGAWIVTLEMMLAYHVINRFDPFVTWMLALSTLAVLTLLSWLRPSRKILLQELSQIYHVIRQPNLILQSLSLGINRISSVERVLLLIILGFLGYTLWSNFTWPVSDWDAIALYDFRAQLIKVVGHWQDGKALGYFYHYPPFTSLLHGALYQLGFERVKIVYTLLFASFLLVFYRLLRPYTTRTQALVGVVLTSISPLVWGHVMVAYTNLPYTIYFGLALLYAWRWLETKEITTAIISMLLVMASIWVRQSEPFWLIILILLGWGAWQAKTRMTWLVLGGLLVLFSLSYNYWPKYTQSLDLPPPPVSVNDALGYSVPVSLATIIHHGFLVTDHVLTSVIKPIFLLLIPAVVVLCFDSHLVKKKRIQVMYATLLVMFGVVFMGTYYFSFTYRSWNLIGESLTRLIMVMVPLLVYLISQSSYWDLILPKAKHRRRL